MVGGAALDGDGDDLAGELIGVVLEVRLDLLDLERGVMLAFVFEILQQVVLSLLLRQAGELFQRFELALLDHFDLVLRGGNICLTAAEIVFLAFEGVELLVERLFLLLEAALLLLQVGAALLDFLFVFGSGFMNFLFRFHEHLALLILAALDGFVDDTRCFGFCASDLTLRDFLAIEHADQKEDKCYNQQSCDEQDVTIPFHCRNTPPVLQIGCVCHEKVMLPPATPMHRANKQIHCLLYRFTSRKSSNYAGKIVSLQENLCKAYKALTTCSRNDRIVMSWKRNSFSVFNLIDTRV